MRRILFLNTFRQAANYLPPLCLGESSGGHISPRQNKLVVRVFISWVRSGEDSAKNAVEARNTER